MSHSGDNAFIPPSVSPPSNSDSSLSSDDEYQPVKPALKRKGRPPRVQQPHLSSSNPRTSTMFNSTNAPRNVTAALNATQARGPAPETPGRPRRAIMLQSRLESDARRGNILQPRPDGEPHRDGGRSQMMSDLQPKESRPQVEIPPVRPPLRSPAPTGSTPAPRKKKTPKCFS